ncbi:MAG: TlpA disulfide reductase family protein, partial [Pseudomonadota bacterium]
MIRPRLWLAHPTAILRALRHCCRIGAPVAAMALLYGALTLSATPVAAATAASPAVLNELRAMAIGPVSKMEIHRAVKPVKPIMFRRENGRPATLADFRGKVVLVNFWATWCAPCKREMPGIDNLSRALKGQDFEVVTISLDRGGARQARRFFDSIKARNLELFVDPKSRVARGMGVVGLPVSVLIDRSGQEV